MSWNKLVINVLRRWYKTSKRVNFTPTQKHGLKPTVVDARDYKVKVSVPMQVADQYLIAKLPPVRNQLNLGSCASHAAVEAVETITLNTHPDKYMELSELYHYYYARQENGSFPNDDGQTLRNACQTMLDYGNALDAVWPYVPNNFNIQPPAVAKMFSNFFGITAYRSVDNFDDIYQLLANNTPIIVGIDVYSDFYSLNPTMFQYMGTGNFVGGHAVLLVGYDKTTNSLCFRNSWGPTFGSNGNFLISVDHFKTLNANYGMYVVEVLDGMTWASS